MMDKKKQIEEIARDLADPMYACFAYTRSCKECVLEGDCIPHRYAEAAYNAGYRKSPKEEKQKLLHEMYEQGKFDGVVKFAEMLKEKFAYDIERCKAVDEICKEFIGDEQ